MADFNPYTDASLNDYLDDTCTFAVNPNGSGGTPTDGQECKYWGGKLGVIAATTTSTLGTLVGPTWRESLAGGKPALVNAAGHGLSFGQPAALTTPINAANAQFTVLAVFKPTAVTPNFSFVVTKSAAGTAQNIRLGLGVFPSGGDYLAGLPGTTGQPVVANQFVVASHGSDFGTNRRNCRKSKINAFGGWGVNSQAPADAVTDVMIGGQNYASAGQNYVFNAFVGEIYAVFFFNKYLSAYEIKAATDQIHDHYAQARPDAQCRHNIYTDSDSISTITDYPQNFTLRIGGHPVYSEGWGGKKAADQIAWFEEDTAKLAEYNARTNGLPALFGLHGGATNDLAGGATPETAFEYQRRWLTQVGPYASKRFATTCITRTPGSFSRDFQMRFNGYLRRDWAQFADALCDFDGTLLDAEDAWASTWLVGDGIHPRSPVGMDAFKAPIAATLASLMDAPASAATSWVLGTAASPAGGQTSGDWTIAPYLGTAASVVLVVASSNASDILTSTDSRVSGSGTNTLTVTFPASGVGAWTGCVFRVKYGATTGARTISATVGATVVASSAATPSYSGGVSACPYFPSNTSTTNRTYGNVSSLLALKLRTNASTSTGTEAGLPSGTSGTVVITPSVGTLTVVGGSETWDNTNSELFYEWTRPAYGTGSSPVTFTGACTVPGVTLPALPSLHYDDAAPSIALVAPPATAPRTTKDADSYMGTARVRGTRTGTVTVPITDSLGRTASPATLTFGPNVTCLPYYLTAGSPGGVHSISATNSAGLTNPSAVSFTDNAGPYAGPLGFTAVNPTSFTVTSPAPTGGTGPFTYLFESAPEAAGGVPGAWAAIAAASSSQSATLTGLTAYTRRFVRCTVTDANSLASVSPIYDFLTSSLAAGITSVSAITSTTATATTTGGANGFGTKTYQARIATVSGGPYTPVGTPGASLARALSGLSSATSYYVQVGTIDSHPLAPGTVYDPEVTFITLSGAHINPAAVLLMGY